MLDVAKHPRDGHLSYAFVCALGSHTLRRHWEGVGLYAQVPALLKRSRQRNELVEPSRSAADAQFDSQKNLKVVKISCVPERMRYTVDQFAVTVGQPLKIIFTKDRDDISAHRQVGGQDQPGGRSVE